MWSGTRDLQSAYQELEKKRDRVFTWFWRTSRNSGCLVLQAWNRCTNSSPKLNGEVGLAWNNLKQLQSNFAINGTLENSRAKVGYSWWNNVGKSSQCCLDGEATMARSSSLEFFGRNWKWQEMRFWESEWILFFLWLLGLHTDQKNEFLLSV